MNHLSLLAFTAFALFFNSTHTYAHSHEAAQHQQPAAEVNVTVQKIGETVHLLQGQGGNIAVWNGADGAVMIDADFAEVTPTLLKAVKTFTDQNISYLVNTHWHGDHTGGNAHIGETNAKIIAHDSVRPRLMVDNYIKTFDMNVKAQPPIGLPQMTFNDTLTLHMNDGEMRLIHIPHAHTDGDIIVHLPKDNIIHAGDLFFNGFYPFIDAATGGTMHGMIAGVEKILVIADDQTKIIPGHGPLSNKAELMAYLEMLKGVRDSLKPLIDSGKTMADIAAAKPLVPFDAVWGDGFLPPEKFLGIAVESMKPQP